ncbi:hypothetical protein MKJ04_10395 [Pontibacter sp. E15-1]|uniref:hypothetical protein n=1 Tax=Pontibacter sp. E15-1 TaxID=2919918 RepID=UPI001F501AE3|nr:hypothetical protein [Pontibacter sp. E15-1]MCJ8165253.1 hypothetical protein [Pontibacter sp. E15-1]
MIAKSIIKQNAFLIKKLIENGRTDLNVIALILCESYFRKTTDRLVEYLAMPFLYLLNKKRFESLSIGVGQIQLKHWIKVKKIQSPLSLNAYSSYFSVIENYDLLNELIKQNLGSRYNDSKLIAFHTGETRKFHFNLFQELKTQISITFK